MSNGAQRRSSWLVARATAIVVTGALAIAGVAGTASAGSPAVTDAAWLDADGDRVADRFARDCDRAVLAGDVDLRPVVVQLDRPPTAKDEAAVEALGGVVLERWERVLWGLYVALPPDAVKACGETPHVVFVDDDYPGRTTSVTTTRQVGARAVWLGAGALSPYRGRPEHRIAVLDSGVDDSHPDIDVAPGGWRDIVSTGIGSPHDELGHGTMVAGIAAGSGAAAAANRFDITFPGIFPTPEGTSAVWTFPVHTGTGTGTIAAYLQWAAASGRHRLAVSHANGTLLSSIASTTEPLSLSVTLANATSDAFQVAFASQTGDSANTAGTFYQGQVTTPYNAFDVFPLTSGVAPDAQIVGVRIVDAAGTTSSARIISGLEWVSGNRAALQIVVVNLSVTLDNGVLDANVDAAVNKLVDEGVLVVVAAGNYPAGNGIIQTQLPPYPANLFIGSPGTATKALTVGAVNHLDQVTFYTKLGDSTRPAKPDVLAPGGSSHILGSAGTRPVTGADSNDGDAAQNPANGSWVVQPDGWANDYMADYGTSYAAAVVSGAVALIGDARGGWSWYAHNPANQVFAQAPLLAKALLLMTSHEVQVGETSASGLDVATPQLARNLALQDRIEGYGRVNVQAAIEAMTLPYSPAEGGATFGAQPFDRKVWARYVDLDPGEQLTVSMSVSAGLDADVYLFDGTPNDNGTPVLRAWSTNPVNGQAEALTYTRSALLVGVGRYYLVVKRVGGAGTTALTGVHAEHCDAIDNDNDGLTDENGGGAALTTPCWEGPFDARGVGECADGLRTCTNGAWSSCVGQVLPNGVTPFRAEYYNGMDFQEDALASPAAETMLQFDNYTTGFGLGQDADYFASRWRSQLCVEGSGTYDLRIMADCRFTLALGLPGGLTTIIPDDGNCQGTVETVQASVSLNPGCVALEATHRHGTGNATFRLDLRPPAAGWIPLTGQWTQKSPILCDLKDDDCEGDPEVVDFPTLGQACDGPDVDACRYGTWTCRADLLGVECANENPTDVLEDCNGADDDCDGLTDESLTGGILKRSCWEGPLSVDGTGACTAGEESCVAANWTGDCVGQVFPSGASGFLIRYYSDADLGTLVAQAEADVVQEIANVDGFHPLQPSDHFSTRYETEFCVDAAGTYTFYGTADDGQRLHFDLGEGPFLLFEDWVANGAPTEVTADIPLTPGCYGVRYETFDDLEGALSQLEFSGPDIARQLLQAPYAWRRTESACDYVDDDCDGATDEGWELDVACDGDDKDLCENGVTICSADGTVVVCGTENPADIDEVCNGVDDDCDGTTDEDFPLGEECIVGEGECTRTGEYVCDPAQVGFECSVISGDPTEEICDGLDNDCDGETDEAEPGVALTVHCYEGPAGSEDVGVCIGGLRTCVEGAYGPCEGDILPAGNDGWTVEWYDNPNLDGTPRATGAVGSIDYSLEIDETPTSGVPSDGFSARFRSTVCLPANGEYTFYGTADDGQRLFIDLGEGPSALINNWVNQPPHEVAAAITLDAGCYDLIYEWYEDTLGAVALVEIESADAGIERQLLAAPWVWQQEESFCDDRDDDCDGDTDEQYPLGESCDGPDSDFCENGVLVCALDGIGTVCGDEDPADLIEECNGEDDDCDGDTDEDDTGATLSRSCYSGDAELLGVGICAEGLSWCREGDWAECLGDVTPAEGFRAWYFEGAAFETLVAEAIAPAVAFDVRDGGLVPAQTTDWISARFETSVCVPADGTYQFRATAEGGQRVYVDVGTGWITVIDQWAPLPSRSASFGLFLAAGCTPLRYEWFDMGGSREALLEVQSAGLWTPLDGPWTSRPDELCNGLDDDCDGDTDESGLVDDVTGDPLPLVEACYDGPQKTLGVGACEAGERVCGEGAWDACSGGAPAVAAPGFMVSWYDNRDLAGDPVLVDRVPFIDMAFEPGVAPREGLPAEGWSARFEGLLCLEGPVSTLRFYLTHDDGGVLSVDRGEGWETLIDDWGPDGPRTIGTDDLAFVAGCHPVRYDTWNDSLASQARVEFSALELEAPIELLGWPWIWQLEETACDGADDDCDGRIDDEWTDLFSAACDGDDSDLCENGVYVCAPDGDGVVCGDEDPADIQELCNGADEDCDGETDEDFTSLGMACDGDDADECASGTWTCAADGLGVECVNETGLPYAEQCDTVDNDCDGLTDEDFTDLGTACDGEDGDQCANGVYVCATDGTGVTCGVEDPADIQETCDGFDDDCDGQTDEGLGVTECGAGACQHTIANCENATEQTCDPMEGATPEICDGRDNDCDGVTDDEDLGALCVDDNPCTDDACDAFNGCAFVNNTAPCDDDNACTDGDACAGGACVAGAAVVCDDDNACTDDTCNPATGCAFANNTTACDDGDACTEGDACAGGACASGAARICDDGNACTDDSCDSAVGCEYADNTAACDDDDACTDGDVCAAGACVSGEAVPCDDDNVCTDDSCDAATGCVFANNTAGCDDGDVCTEGDVCADGACAAGTAVDCDDADPCTTETCDTTDGCQYEDVAGCCVEDADCTEDGEFCVVVENRCAPDVCSGCAEDTDCGGEDDLCVALGTGSYCGRDCSAGQACAPGTTCTDLDDGAKQCLPEEGDCDCSVAESERACHEGDVVWFSSCGAAGAVAEDCGGRGCLPGDAGDACCPDGTALTEGGDECVTPPAEPQPEPVAEGGDKPDVVTPDVKPTGDGITVEDTAGGGDDTGGGGGGGGGGCATAPASTPWAGATLLLLLALALAWRRRRA